MPLLGKLLDKYGKNPCYLILCGLNYILAYKLFTNIKCFGGLKISTINYI